MQNFFVPSFLLITGCNTVNCDMSIRVLQKQEVLEAERRIHPYIYQTPVLYNETINRELGRQIFFKCENLQRTGSFKIRGALYALGQLKTACNHVITHSSGNHGAAVACAAREFDLGCTVIMPRTAPKIKRENVARYKARIVTCAPTMQAREETTARILTETGGCLVHPFDDYAIMAGQGTAALELLNQYPGINAIITPVGGGGLLSGTATIAKALNSKIIVMGSEPEAANDQQMSFQQKKRVAISDPVTIADGLRTTCPGEKPFATILAYVDDICTISETSIRRAMRLIWDHLKIIVEPSGAVPLAALLEGRLHLGHQKVGVILSGGNIDLDTWTW